MVEDRVGSSVVPELRNAAVDHERAWSSRRRWSRIRNARPLRDASPGGFDLGAKCAARRAIAGRAHRRRVRIERCKLARILEDPATVIIHETLGQRALGNDDVVGIELYMEVIDALDPIGLNN